MPKNIFYYVGLLTQVGLTIIFCIIISLLIGRFLDYKLNLKGIFTAIFIFIGIAAGLFSAFKQLQNKNDK